MRILIIFSFLFLNLFFIQITIANDDISIKDITNLYKDEKFIEDNIKINKISSDGINLIQFLNSQQKKISMTTQEYLTTEMSNEELWETLDLIYEQADIYVKKYDSEIKALNISSLSQIPLAQSLYNSAIEQIYKINEYINASNKINKDLIDHLREGDLDKYDYLFARSYFNSADFLDILSEHNYSQAQRLPTSNINKWVLLIDSEVIDFIAIATRVNASEMLGELNEEKLNEYKYALESKYKKLTKGNSYKNLINSVNNLKNLINQISDGAYDLSNKDIAIMESVAINAKLYSDANIRLANTWNEITEFYKDNIKNIDNIHKNSSLILTFNDIQKRQAFIQGEVQRYGNEYQASMTEFNKVAPKLVNL